MIECILWTIGILLVAWFWEEIEERWLEWRWEREQKRRARAWQQWYAQHPCKPSHTEPWRRPWRY